MELFQLFMHTVVTMCVTKSGDAGFDSASLGTCLLNKSSCLQSAAGPTKVGRHDTLSTEP